MWNHPPAAIGTPVADVDTPALLVELDAFERNVATMAGFAARAGVRLRPHAKTHKCPEIALAQVAAGAVGVCVQKVSEAEALVAGGIDDVLVANEVVGAPKVARLARLAREARVAVAVDAEPNVAALGAAARAARVELTVLVEIDVGARRCGVAPGADAVALAARIADEEGLRFGGLQAYQGAVQHHREPGERRAAIDEAVRRALATRDRLHAAGLACPVITGGGTGTFTLEAGSGVYTEIQPGSYVFMDADYGRNAPEPGAPRFEQSLFVLATVMSAPPGRAVLDAGLKAHSVDSGLPVVLAEGWTYARAMDEHGLLEPSPGAAPLALGDKVRLVPGHCDPTVNLYDWIVGVREGRVEALWPVAARGALL